jgi:hypothetical protein
VTVWMMRERWCLSVAWKLTGIIHQPFMKWHVFLCLASPLYQSELEWCVLVLTLRLALSGRKREVTTQVTFETPFVAISGPSRDDKRAMTKGWVVHFVIQDLVFCQLC